MMPSHHPSEDLLLAYASGSQPEPVALLVATHLALCPACRAEVSRLEAVGGMLLDELEPEPVAEGCLDGLLSRLDAPPPSPSEATSIPPAPDPDLRLPQPLRDYVGGDFDSVRWRSIGPVAKTELLSAYPGYKTRLLRVRAGTAIPWHTHVGEEYTLVLKGRFSDSGQRFLRGDVAFADSSVTHRPIVDSGEDCICLLVTEGPLRLTGPLGRLFNPFLRI